MDPTEQENVCAKQEKQIQFYIISLRNLQNRYRKQREDFLREIIMLQEQLFFRDRIGGFYDEQNITSSAMQSQRQGDTPEPSPEDDKFKKLSQLFADEKRKMANQVKVCDFPLSNVSLFCFS